MNTDALFAAIGRDAALTQLSDALGRGQGTAAVFGMPDPVRHLSAAMLARERTLLYVTATEAEAVRVHALLSEWTRDALLFLPRSMPLVHVQAASYETRAPRLHTLTRLVLGIPTLVVAPAAALLEALAPPEAFVSTLATVSAGDVLSPQALVATLTAGGYERVDMVEGRGQCARRGDIVDVFPPQADDPYRVEFFGDEVDQIRVFDALTQRSLSQAQAAVFPPAFETPQTPERIRAAARLLGAAEGFTLQRAAWEQGAPCVGADVLLPLLYAQTVFLTAYLPKDAYILVNEPQRVLDEARAAELIFSETLAATLERGEGHPMQEKLLGRAGALMPLLDTPRTAAVYAMFRSGTLLSNRTRVASSAITPPQYLGNTEQLAADLICQKTNRETVLIYAGEAMARLGEELAEHHVPFGTAAALDREPVAGEILLLGESLPQGFAFPELHLTVLTRTEIFLQQQAATKKKKRNALQFSDLAVGDYVVHESHGIGRFTGVEQLTVVGSTRDYLLFSYRGGDKLYIPTDQLDRISKYIGGSEDAAPQLSRLGGGDWQQRVGRAKAGAKKLAVDLAMLYAARATQNGFAFSPDTPWQRKLEASFPYVETPDQAASLADIKRDMESPRPMDRLLCGDVGYGKTEVALRAAFKAVQDSKQVALLVPTTILAQQHYNTLTARFYDFPVRVGCLSRFQPPAERALVKKRLQNGELDVVVGTHALLSKDVVFRDLGLLIIDEEHRFGVNHKEKIKALRQQVDVLTLTATPIPRTLNLSMTGIRDISTIDTPPENRFPVQTFVMEYTDALLTTALRKELSRGGQAFVVSNNVLGMEGMLEKLRTLVPDARIDMAHGQMPEQQLEQAMLAFLNHETDVLLCSTIIESGVDIPNANTLVVLDADKLGLAQLYQLRGRVGRATRMAYAYLTVQQSRQINEQAQKRLLAIREFTQFGAGFRLAMRDLEIRGAGALIGAEQHGHIADIGYDYYCKLMRQAVGEARGEPATPAVEPVIDLPLDAYIPHSFVKSEVLRLSMYKRIAEIADRTACDDLWDEFTDRYGDLPAEVTNLMQLALIRAYAARARIVSVAAHHGRLTLKYDVSAAPDGARLLAVLQDEPDAHLLATEPPAIEIYGKTADLAKIVTNLPQFLYRLAHCNTEESAV